MPSIDQQSTEECTLSDGRTIAYLTGGDPNGVPAVVHHGTPGSRLFAGLLSNVAAEEGIFLIVPDRPGYGYSTPPPRGWTWEDWREDLHELLDAESVDHTVAIGFSGGGPFALAAARSDRIRRVGLVSSVLPPADDGLAGLSKIPFAVRVLFWLSKGLVRITGPDAVVEQYTDRSVSDPVSRAVADDFREALRQGPRAVARESRSFATGSIDPNSIDVKLRAWHGTRDENASLSPVRSFVQDADGTLITEETDHLGTLLDCRREVFQWLREG